MSLLDLFLLPLLLRLLPRNVLSATLSKRDCRLFIFVSGKRFLNPIESRLIARTYREWPALRRMFVVVFALAHSLRPPKIYRNLNL